MSGTPPSKPARDPAPAGMREQIRMAASQAWQQPVEPLYLGRAARIKVRFDVPGLRRNGTVLGQQRTRQFFAVLLRVTFYLMLGVFFIIWFGIQVVINIMLDSGNFTIGFLGAPHWKRRLEVMATQPTEFAVPVGRALARARGHVWLVIGPTAAAVTQVVAGNQTVLSAANGPAHPVLELPRYQLYWPDRSILRFKLPRGEERKFYADRPAREPRVEWVRPPATSNTPISGMIPMAVDSVSDIRIWKDPHGHIQYWARQGSRSELVINWLTADIEDSGSSFIRLLDAIEQRRSGSTDRPYKSGGKAWQGLITKDYVNIEHEYANHLKGTVPLDVVLGILRAYGNALGESVITAGKVDFARHRHREPQLPW